MVEVSAVATAAACKHSAALSLFARRDDIRPFEGIMLALSATLLAAAATGGPKPPAGCTTVRQAALPRLLLLALLCVAAAPDPNSCPCPILHPGTPGTFCPLDKTPGQCSKLGPHKPCKAGGTCPHCPNCDAPVGCKTVHLLSSSLPRAPSCARLLPPRVASVLTMRCCARRWAANA